MQQISKEENVAISNEVIEKGTIYSFEEAMAATTQYFKGDEMAAKVWVSKTQ